MREIREHDRVGAYTASRTDEELLEYTTRIISYSKASKALCAQHNISFIDTSRNRDTVLTSVFREIEKKISQADNEV